MYKAAGFLTCVSVFSSAFSQEPKTRGAEVFLPLLCEWVGGSFVAKNQGSKSTQVRLFHFFPHLSHVPSGVHLVILGGKK